MNQATIEEHEGIIVVRDDLFPGGTKARILPALMQGASEVVFGGPFCGGAPVALSVVGQALRIPVTLFFAERKEWHPRQRLCQSFGAGLVAVSIGRMSKVQKVAREYAERKGALFFKLGYDMPLARDGMLGFMREVRQAVGSLDYLYLSMGTGMLAICAATIWPEARIVATAVGLKSRWSAQEFPVNIEIVEWPTTIDKPSLVSTPFPCDPYYDKKAWETLKAQQASGRVLFWNVLGEPEAGNTWREGQP